MQGANLNVPIFSQDRALLAEIVAKNIEMGLKDATQLPGFIRSEVVLGTTNEITFKIGVNEQANGQNIFPTENRLALNDAFFVKEWGVMFYAYDTSGTPEAQALARARARLHTWANPNVFNAASVSVDSAYNGKLSLRVDDTVFVDSMDMLRFMRIGTAQEGVELSTGATSPAYLGDTFLNSEMFAHETNPLVRLNGMGKNVLRVQLPSTENFAAVSGQAIVAVAYLRGWLSQNGGAARTANTR